MSHSSDLSGYSSFYPMPSNLASETTPRETWHGFIHTTWDAILIVEACLLGGLHHLPRRPHDRERQGLIQSGAVFVYERNASGITRFTDGRKWGPSRGRDNFLIYREEMDDYKATDRSLKRKSRSDEDESAAVHSKQPRDEIIRALYGALHDDAVSPGQYKPGGLMKKTISVTWNNVVHHVVSYYDPADVLARRLTRPKFDPYITELVSRNGGPRQFEGKGWKCSIHEGDNLDLGCPYPLSSGNQYLPLDPVTLPRVQDGYLPQQAPQPAETLVPLPPPQPLELPPAVIAQPLENDVSSKSGSCSPPAAQRRRIGSAPVSLHDEYYKSQAVAQRANHSPQQQSSPTYVFSPAQMFIYTGTPGVQDFQIPPAYPMSAQYSPNFHEMNESFTHAVPRFDSGYGSSLLSAR